MPRHFWRITTGVLVALALYAGLVKHDGTFCHDVLRTGFRTDTPRGKVAWTAAVICFWLHILKWPADRRLP